MAFKIYNWSCVSSSVNQGLVSAVIAPGVSPVLQGSMNLFSYYSTDAVAVINAVDYFLPVIEDLNLYDVIMVTGSDASEFIQVSAITKPDDNGNGGTVTTASFTTIGAVGTANLVNLAVTTAKIDNLAVTTGKIADAAVTSAKLALTTIQYATVAITAAQFNGMYAAPKLLIANAGANTMIILDRVELMMTYVSANYAAGGVAAVQYDSTANGAGVIASTTLAAATFQAAVSTGFNFNAGVVAQTFSTCVNKGLYLSNITGAFTTGDSTFIAHVWYKVISTV